MKRRRLFTNHQRRRSQPWLLLAVILLAGITVELVLLTALGVPAATPSGAAGAAQGEAHVSGAERYAATCASCHGASGQGHVFPAAPALDHSEHAWHHSDQQIIEIMRRGGRQMPALAANWRDQEVEVVLAYLKQWWTPEQRQTQRGTIGE